MQPTDGSHIGDRDLASIRVPVTILTGDLSPSFLQKTSSSLARRLPAVTTRTLQGAGHAMSFDQPEALLAEVRRALDGAPESPQVLSPAGRLGS